MTNTVEPHVLAPPFNLQSEVTIRMAMKEDLPKLEWFGAYTHYRRLFERTFEDQERGYRLMVVASVNDFPIGQIFLHMGDEGRSPIDRRFAGYLYSLRVLEPFQRQGLGTRLILQAESLLRRQSYRWVTIAVAKDNDDAKRLYEKLDYSIFSEDEGRWQYVDHQGCIRHVHEPSWMLRKDLRL